jgi:DNA-binding CsgD family transcriptional regulator
VEPTAELIALIYGALDEREGWQIFLAAFAQRLNCTQAQFWASGKDPRTAVFGASYGVSEEVMRIVASPEYSDPWLTRVRLDHMPMDLVIASDKMCPDETLEQDYWYQKVLLPNRWHYGGGVMLQSGTHESAGMSVLRPKEQGPLTPNEVALWQSLVPHLKCAVRLHRERVAITRERDALMRYFDDIGQGVMLAAADGTLLAANEAARRVIDQGQVLYVREGRLEVVDRAARPLMVQAMRQTGFAGLAAEPAAIRLNPSNVADAGPLVAVVLQVTQRLEQVGTDLPSAVIYLRDATARTEFDPAPLRQLFGMTSAQAAVACLVASGLDLAEAAQRLCVSMHTVRSHLKMAMLKTSVKRQAELAILVPRICRITRKIT